jgi:O-acetylserine/cysteine efflux transporter
LAWPHALLALAIVIVWGTNFAVTKIALNDFPPLFVAALRFFFSLFPAILFLPRPAVSWRNLAGYGVLIGVVQFGFLYYAMERFISPGLASLVVQMQVFFTIGLAIAIDREKVGLFQWSALGLAALGLGIIIFHAGGDASPLGVLLVLLASAGWSGGNQVGRSAGSGINMLAYVVWASLFAVPLLLIASLTVDGWPAIAADIRAARPADWLSIGWQAGNTLFGYGCWAWLMARYPAATVAPLSLLVPVFGFATSAIMLGEPLPPWKLEAAALVIGGLALNMLWPRLRQISA